MRLWIDPGEGRVFETLLDVGAEIALGCDGAVCAADASLEPRQARVLHAGHVIQAVALAGDLSIHGVRVPSAWLGVGSAFEIGRTVVRVGPAARPEEGDAAPLPGLVGRSLAMRRLAASVRKVASLRLPVLVRGDTGTGKDLVARAVHDESTRARGPFVALNAAAITRELAESELFGHLRGSFTGAARDRRGAFREAHGGTLFLDEIGALPLELQAKLLRAVEERVVRPLGAEASIPVDVRLVAATCEPLEEMVATGRFRADLYERLAVCRVVAPPLRERTEDIEALSEHLLDVSGLGDRKLTRGAIMALRGHDWPGNVRELRNVLVQAAVGGHGPIEAGDVAMVLAPSGARAMRLAEDTALRIFEEVGRNVSAAARRAEVPRTTMRDLLRSAGVPPWPRGEVSVSRDAYAPEPRRHARRPLAAG